MYKKLEKLYQGFVRVYWNFVTALFAVLSLSIIIQVITRALGMSLPWTEELARTLLVYTTLLAAPLVSRDGGHLGAYFLRDLTKGRTKGAIIVLNTLVTLCVLFVLIRGGILMYVAAGDATAVTIPWIKRSWFYVALIVGCVFVGLYALRDIYRCIQLITGKKRDALHGKSGVFFGEDK